MSIDQMSVTQVVSDQKM